MNLETFSSLSTLHFLDLSLIFLSSMLTVSKQSILLYMLGKFKVHWSSWDSMSRSKSSMRVPVLCSSGSKDFLFLSTLSTLQNSRSQNQRKSEFKYERESQNQTSHILGTQKNNLSNLSPKDQRICKFQTKSSIWELLWTLEWQAYEVHNDRRGNNKTFKYLLWQTAVIWDTSNISIKQLTILRFTRVIWKLSRKVWR